MRRCGRCDQGKPEEEFAWRRRFRGQRDNYCRPCRAAYKQEHYAANRERYIADARRRKEEAVAARVAFLIDFLRAHPCVDCGEADPLVLEFDHVDGKEFGIAKGLRDASGRACSRRCRDARWCVPTATAAARRFGRVLRGRSHWVHMPSGLA